MKSIFIIVVSIFAIQISVAYSQESLAGTYINTKAKEAGGVGKLLLYPIGSDAYLFSLKLNRGAPSYNSGHLFGELIIKDSKSVYENNRYEIKGNGCKWSIVFKEGVATIDTIDFSNKCGMGNGVYADGQYTIESKDIPEFYINSLGNKVKFSSHR